MKTNNHQNINYNNTSGEIFNYITVTIGLLLSSMAHSRPLEIKSVSEKHKEPQEWVFPDITESILGTKVKIKDAITIPFSQEYLERLKMEQDTTYFEDPSLIHLFYGLQKGGTTMIVGNINRVLSYTTIIQDKINLYAAKTGIRVPIRLLQGLILTESGGDPKIVSFCGAKGLCQFMPGTAKQYHVNVFDPVSSIDGAVHKLTDDYKKFGNRTYAISAYHMGPGNVTTLINTSNAEGVPLADASQLVDPNLPQSLISFLDTKKDDTELYFRKIQSAIWLLNKFKSDPEYIKFEESQHQNIINQLIGLIKNPDNLKSTQIVSLLLNQQLAQDPVEFDHTCLISQLSSYVGTNLEIMSEPVGDNSREAQTIIGEIHQKYPSQGLLIKKPNGGSARSRLDHVLKYHTTQGNIRISQSGLYYYVVPLREFTSLPI